KIKAVQSERDRLSMLLAEYVDDIVLSQNSHPTTHHLFEEAPEINEESVKNILSFYETGKLRFQEVLAEDVYKTKPRTSKRRTRNINRYTYTYFESIRKQKRRQIGNPIQESIVQQNTLISQQTSSLSSSTTNPYKRPCRTTTEPEKTILAQLFELEDTVSENEIQKVLSELLTVSPDWTKER
ncbi:17414_t:CDS:2, partial [Racocetra fulgida]